MVDECKLSEEGEQIIQSFGTLCLLVKHSSRKHITDIAKDISIITFLLHYLNKFQVTWQLLKPLRLQKA